MNSLLGMRIHESSLAVQTVFVVERWPIKKKRRGWQVIKQTRPCAFVVSGKLDFIGNGQDKLVIHPDALKRITKIVL